MLKSLAGKHITIVAFDRLDARSKVISHIHRNHSSVLGGCNIVSIAEGKEIG